VNDNESTFLFIYLFVSMVVLSAAICTKAGKGMSRMIRIAMNCPFLTELSFRSFGGSTVRGSEQNPH
jgi:hypothetical protein